MDYRKKQYWKDLAKWYCYSFLDRHVGKLQTPMQQVLLQLKIKKLLPKQMDALEMFGMHGLWHTMDYVGEVDALDFFEIDPVYLELAKRKLSKYNVKFHCEDSIAYIAQTKKMYSFIVADIPRAKEFYADDGLPLFLKHMINCASAESVVMFNCPTAFFNQYAEINYRINAIRKAADIFWVARNKGTSYIVVVFRNESDYKKVAEESPL